MALPAILALDAGVARAELCPSTYDCKLPNTTKSSYGIYCSASATTQYPTSVKVAGITRGTVSLRTSTHCLASWARTTTSSSGAAVGPTEAERRKGDWVTMLAWTSTGLPRPGTSTNTFSEMVFDFKTTALVSIFVRGTGYVVYAGQTGYSHTPYWVRLIQGGAA